jgi:cob(I)alamin adenosyltransferase
MSIVTKTGDEGTTGLMYNRRVPKSHPRVEAYGAVDELNAALGLARATTREALVCEQLERTQRDLVVLMGEIATAVEDLPRYVKDGHSLVSADMTARLDCLVKEIEAKPLQYRDWVMPGANVGSAALDLARTTCRRAERRVCSLREAGELHNPEIIVYLNRLSDLLWLLARCAEAQPEEKRRDEAVE